ncbi:hypothetical protein Pmani_028289 [Petrolisthes manimaculis]|uniref:Uncharacterized protein n=1 Tax=Petrolisthes manimaculis TaxID=1843537 RepID=A0AAE1P0E2_9EUCA|nr:hypothetical protein Pmani_028289 [Petrolisthes manimaculis]
MKQMINRGQKREEEERRVEICMKREEEKEVKGEKDERKLRSGMKRKGNLRSTEDEGALTLFNFGDSGNPTGQLMD